MNAPRPLPRDRDPAVMSDWERWRAGLAHLLEVRRNPDNTAAVLRFGILVNARAARRLIVSLRASEPGRALLRERPAIDRSAVDYDALAALPAGTLGHEYQRFLRENELDPDVFRPPPNVSHPDAAYLAQRLRQTHDLWHVLTGYGTDEGGEVELQAFTHAQLGLPSSLVLATTGALRRARYGDLTVPLRTARAWVRGRSARPLLAFRWENHWAERLDRLRLDLLGAA